MRKGTHVRSHKRSNRKKVWKAGKRNPWNEIGRCSYCHEDFRIRRNAVSHETKTMCPACRKVFFPTKKKVDEYGSVHYITPSKKGKPYVNYHID